MKKLESTHAFPEKRNILKIISDSFLLQDTEREGFFRFEFEIKKTGNLDLLSWLKAQNNLFKIYFSEKKGTEFAGIGVGDIISDNSLFMKSGEKNNSRDLSLEAAIDRIHKRIALSKDNPRYFGAAAFDRDDLIDPTWNSFGRFFFIAPLIEISGTTDKKTLSVNFYYNPENSSSKKELYNYIKEVIANLAKIEKFDLKKNFKSRSRQDFPEKDTWKQNVNIATQSFGIENISKVVLARKTVFNLKNFEDPLCIFNLLRKQNIKTHDYYIQIDKHYAFFGCSPELLFHREKNKLTSDAIAGTVLKGTSIQEERLYAEKLLSSQKEAEEFGFVFKDIKKELKKLSKTLNFSENKEILALSYAQHIRRRFSCVLKDNITNYSILQALHPTPAVSGYPYRNIFRLLKRYENFYRGFYSGPVGWIGKDSSCFVVGIRSGILDERRLSVFSGAGLVKKSIPETEWEEIENKILPFLKIIK